MATETTTPAAEETTQTGAAHPAAGEGGETGATTGQVDANALRDEIEAELRDTLRREIEADVKRKLAGEISKAKSGQSDEVEAVTAERDALATRVQELQAQLEELQVGLELSAKRSALEAALEDIVPANLVRLLVREYEGRVKVKGDQVVPLTSDGKEDLIVQGSRTSNRPLKDFLRAELAAAGYEDLLKPSVRGGADTQSTEAAGATSQMSASEAFNSLLRGAMR